MPIACHTWLCPCFSVVMEAMHEENWGHLKGSVPAQKAIPGSFKGKRYSLLYMEKIAGLFWPLDLYLDELLLPLTQNFKLLWSTQTFHRSKKGEQAEMMILLSQSQAISNHVHVLSCYESRSGLLSLDPWRAFWMDPVTFKVVNDWVKPDLSFWPLTLGWAGWLKINWHLALRRSAGLFPYNQLVLYILNLLPPFHWKVQFH